VEQFFPHQQDVLPDGLPSSNYLDRVNSDIINEFQGNQQHIIRSSHEIARYSGKPKCPGSGPLFPLFPRSTEKPTYRLYVIPRLRYFEFRWIILVDPQNAPRHITQVNFTQNLRVSFHRPFQARPRRAFSEIKGS
jgi:hypothetical protein